jgi:hypothetical protein
VQTEAVEQPALPLATVNVVHIEQCLLGVQPATQQVVHLNEEKVYLQDCDDDKDSWVLHTRASNHMMGRREALMSLDTSVHGTVHFGDKSLVEIEDIGSIMLQTRKVGHKVLTEVYFIPKLKSNIISLGQLEEGGCEIVIRKGFCNMYDAEHSLLSRAPRVKNKFYLLKTELVVPVCLVAKEDDEAWLWHDRYGHLNFRALHELGTKEMVEGMLLLDRVDEICDGCVLGKQQRRPFPQVASYCGNSWQCHTSCSLRVFVFALSLE